MLRDDVVDTLALARLTRLIVHDGITEPWRDKIDAHAVIAGGRWEKLSELVTCPWCVAPYLATGIAVARRTVPRVWDPIAKVLAGSLIASTIAATVHTQFDM